MKKRMLAFLLAGAVVLSGIEAQPVLAETKNVTQESQLDANDTTESQQPPEDGANQEDQNQQPAESGSNEKDESEEQEPNEKDEIEDQEPTEGEVNETDTAQQPELPEDEAEEKRKPIVKDPVNREPNTEETVQKPSAPPSKQEDMEPKTPQETFSDSRTDNTKQNASLKTADTPQQQDKEHPFGGYQPIEAIRISDKLAESIRKSDDRLRYFSQFYGSQKYDSSWDVYASNYIYNRLGGSERGFWDLLDTLSKKYLTTTVDATFSRLDTGEGVYFMGEGIGYTYLGLTYQEASDVYLLFCYANPQYYFLRNGFVYAGSSLYPMIYDQFAKGNVRKTESAKMKAQIESMRQKVHKGTNDVEKAKIAHDLIVEKILYDPGFSFENPQPYTPFHQSAYSVFCDDYTVCAGYTKSFSILMNGEGIDTVGVTSSKLAGYDPQGNPIMEGHAWNAVCLNDSWYYIDLTWDDLDGRTGREKQYMYFGISESKLTTELDPTGFHEKEDFYKGVSPKCSKDFGSTVDSVGTVYTPTATTATPVVSQKKASNSMTVTLTCTTPGAEIYYTTDGKNPSSSFSKGFLYRKPFKVTSNVTVKAIAVCDGKWNSAVRSVSVRGKQLLVEFDTRGGNYFSDRKVWSGEAVKKPANPKRKGYQFAGWYKEKKCKNKWNFTSKITKNTTIYAKWNKIKVAKASLGALKNNSGGKMAVSIKKVNKADGYQIRYSTRSDMKKAKKKTIKSTKVTIANMKRGSTYYVQAKAYRKDSAGNKIFGNWSSIKSVTIRK